MKKILFLIIFLSFKSIFAQTITVTTPTELQNALNNAAAGQTIVIADGLYYKSGGFVVPAGIHGSSANPIKLTGSSKAILTCNTISSGGAYGIGFEGNNYWIIEGFSIYNAAKGIVLDNSHHNIVQNLTVNKIGWEGIHLRTYSSFNTVKSCYVDSCGLFSPGTGEGIYIGSSVNNWGSLTGGNPDTCNYNSIISNSFGDHIGSENIDIKEGTKGGYVAFNSFNGKGLNGVNSGDSWIDVKGNNYKIECNTGMYTTNDGFQTHILVAGWGDNNSFANNTLTINSVGYAINVQTSSGSLGATAPNNSVCSNNTSVGAAKGLTNLTTITCSGTCTTSICTATITSSANSFCTGGSVVLTASTGTSYKWFNGTTQVGTASTYTASTAGSYTVEVTNASGCKATSAVTTITVSALPTATITSSANSFCTGGSVVLTASTGISYKWFNGTTQVGTASTYTASTAGSYTLEVTNAAGCKATSAVTTITVSALPTATITSSANSFCTGGSVVLTASTGTSYKWFNGTTQVGTASTYTATTAGSYTVEVTNAAGCKATSPVTTITVNALPTATITSPANSFCTGGSVVLTSSAGTSYKWFNGTTQVGTTSTYTASTAGSYTVEVTNAAGCKATSTVTTITVNALPTATITSPANSFCTGGSVVLTASAGTSYKWFNGTTQVGTTSTYTATTAGSYTVEVTNASGCKATSAVTIITVNALPTATITSPANSFCTGGSVVLTASAGTSYKWFNGTTQVGTAATYTATTAGSYTVEVTNAAGCKAISAVSTITVNALPTATITSPANSFCTGGSVVLTSSAGSSYKWFNGTTQVGTASTYTASTAGSYTVEVTNAAGCKATSPVTTITVSALPTATITSPANSFCTGGSVVLTASTGSSYKWFNGATQVGTAATYTASTAGSYTVEVTNAAGCKATSAVATITVNALPTATITSPANSFCTGGSVVLTASTGSSYKWFNGTTQVGTAATYTASTAGSYTVEVTNTSGCKATSAVTTITVSALPTATITSPANSFCTGGSVVLTASTGTSYKWFNGTTQVGTAATYTATTAGSYTVEVTNAEGCKATSAVTTITVNTSITWYADTDGDGKGDPTATLSACIQPAGYVSVAGDNCPTDVNKIDPGNCGCNNTENSCLDCADIPNGTAAIDVCNVCSGGTTGIIPITNPALCNPTTGNVNTTNAFHIEAQPNPFSDRIELTIPSDARIQLIDMKGNIVLEANNTATLFTSQLTDGLYILRISTVEGTSILKVMKQ